MSRSRVLALLLTLFASTAFAHHNMSAAFDFNDRVSLTGMLSKVDWRNPHIHLELEVKACLSQISVDGHVESVLARLGQVENRRIIELVCRGLSRGTIGGHRA